MYVSNAEEPSLSPRLLSISLTSLSETQTCSFAIAISPINDHHPHIDLSGPDSPTVNYSMSLNFSIFTVNRAAVASNDVIISDGDTDAVAESVRVDLVTGGEGDRLRLSETICSYSNSNTCHLRYK